MSPENRYRGHVTVAAAETLTTAIGQAERDDPVRLRTGGPTGSALLTAWVGLGLLVLFVDELLTLFDARGLSTGTSPPAPCRPHQHSAKPQAPPGASSTAAAPTTGRPGRHHSSFVCSGR
jgi:hypothetical protein